MAKVVSVLSAAGQGVIAGFHNVDDAVAAAINTGQEDIEFETLDGLRVGINRQNVVYIVIDDEPYFNQPGPTV